MINQAFHPHPYLLLFFFFFPLPWWERIKVRGKLNSYRVLNSKNHTWVIIQPFTLILTFSYFSSFFLSPGGRTISLFFPLPWWERIKVRGKLNSYRAFNSKNHTWVIIQPFTLILTFSHQGRRNYSLTSS